MAALEQGETALREWRSRFVLGTKHNNIKIVDAATGMYLVRTMGAESPMTCALSTEHKVYAALESKELISIDNHTFRYSKILQLSRIITRIIEYRE
jgi:hypothetical protein